MIIKLNYYYLLIYCKKNLNRYLYNYIILLVIQNYIFN